jgi:hypothetical protein
MSTPTYKANITDAQQSAIELAEFDGGVPVFEDQKTRVVVKKLGGAEHVSHGTTADVNIGKNAGVSMPWNDKPGRFESDTQGRA